MRRTDLGHTDPPPAREPVDSERPSEPEGEIFMALGAALLGTLVLGQLVGARAHWELLLLLALVAALALVLERLGLRWGRRGGRRTPAARPRHLP